MSDDSPPTPPSVEPDDHDPEFRPGSISPVRKYLPLFGLVIAALLFGSIANRLFGAYRAVVLEIQDDRMLIAFADTPPAWVDAIEAAPGRIIDKAMGSWSPQAIEPDAGDRKLVQLYQRYAAVYTGVVTELLPSAGAASRTALVQTDQGEKVVIKLYAEHLVDVGVGDRVEKRANTWDPDVVERARVVNQPVLLAPPTAPAPEGSAPAPGEPRPPPPPVLPSPPPAPPSEQAPAPPTP